MLKKSLIVLLFFCFSVSLFFSSSQPAQAQQKLFDWLKEQLGGRETGVFVEQPAESILVNVIMWVMSIIGIICVIFIIYGAIIYATSGGNEEHVKRAKQILLYAIIGLVIAIMALVIATLVTRVIGRGAWTVVCDYTGDGVPDQCFEYEQRDACEGGASARYCSCLRGTPASLGCPGF